MRNASTSLVRAVIRACNSGSGSAPARESMNSKMQVLALGSLREICGGDSVVDSPKGSWSPTAGEKSA